MYSGDCVMAPDARPSINAELIPTAIKGVRVQPDAIQRLTWLHEPPCPHAEQGVSRGWRQAQSAPYHGAAKSLREQRVHVPAAAVRPLVALNLAEDPRVVGLE